MKSRSHFAAEWATQLGGLHIWAGYAAGWSAFSTELNGNGFFMWVEWERLFYLDWMGTAFSYELQLGDRRSWVVNAAGWSTQRGDQRSWVINAAGWSTQRGGQRSWVVNAAGWSTQRDGQRSEVVNAAEWSTQLGGQRRWVVGVAEWSFFFFWDASSLAADACPDRDKREDKRGFLLDSASRCQPNRRMMSR